MANKIMYEIKENIKIKINSYEKKITEFLVKILKYFISANVSKPNKEVTNFYKKNNIKINRNQYDKNEIIYKDETWNRVIDRFNDRRKVFYGIKIIKKDNDCINKKIIFENNNFFVRSFGLNDDWIYLTDRREFSNFCLSMDVVFFEKFREIQFGFRHENFYNRYRFRIDSGYVNFDIVFRGKFFNSLFKKEFSPELGRNYNFKIFVNADTYIFLIDDEVFLDVKERWPLIKRGTYAIIFWDDKKHSSISADYTNIFLCQFTTASQMNP